jgi:hypothetical protein
VVLRRVIFEAIEQILKRGGEEDVVVEVAGWEYKWSG